MSLISLGSFGSGPAPAKAVEASKRALRAASPRVVLNRFMVSGSFASLAFPDGERAVTHPGTPHFHDPHDQLRSRNPPHPRRADLSAQRPAHLVHPRERCPAVPPSAGGRRLDPARFYPASRRRSLCRGGSAAW